MNTEQYQRPLRSNFNAVQRCRIFRKDRGEYQRKDTLPHPRENALRMEVALTKASLARPAWEEAQRQNAIAARIRHIEARLLELTGH